jgi:6-phosphogluconolactonase
MRPEIVVDTRDQLARTAAARFDAGVRDAIAERGRYSCALPGGSVAESLFPVLARLALPWERVEVFFGDERAVAQADPDSNVGLARRLWLDAVSARVHAMPADRDDLAPPLRRLADTPPHDARRSATLDLALLGMVRTDIVLLRSPRAIGCCRSGQRWVAEITDSPPPPPRRVTLTFRSLAAARAIWVAAFGAEKAHSIREAIEDPASQLPVALVARSGPPVVFLLDRAAASALDS